MAATLPALALALIAAAPWTARLERSVRAIPVPEGARLDVLVRDASTGETFSTGEHACYLASGVKLPIAFETLRQADEGLLSLNDRVVLRADDVLDGSPVTSRMPPGTSLTVRELVEHAIASSDNTATDLLLRLVGVEQVNATMSRLVPGGFGEITTLADVRRHAYARMHPEAVRLSPAQLRALHDVRDPRERRLALARMLGVPPHEARLPTLDAAYEDYYACGLNSATLSSYARLLEIVAEGSTLCPESHELLTEVMLRTRTGRGRVRAGLSERIAWAHKTGTQHERTADFGLAWRKDRPDRVVIVTAVASGFPTQGAGEAALAALGRAVAASRVFDTR